MMINLDEKDWKEFQIDYLFDIHPTKAYKLINKNLLTDEGSTPVVVNSSVNNGIGGYSNLSPTEKGNMITFSDTTSDNTIFYQEKDFIGYSHVQGMYPKKYIEKWNKLTYLFFLNCFRKSVSCYAFDYDNKFRRDVALNIKVKLPAQKDESGNFIKDKDGNFIPDWKFMEEYMIQLESELMLKIKNSFGQLKEINDKDWQEFDLLKIFNYSKCKGCKKGILTEGDFPYVARSNENNGITRYCGNNEFLNKSNSITIHAEWKDTYCAFYQEKDFVTDGMIGMLENENLNKFNGLFICTLLRKIKYNDQGLSKSLETVEIKLPAKKDESGNFIKDKDGNFIPDWKFMEEYMKGN